MNSNTKRGNVILGEKYRTLWGQDFLMDTLCGLAFKLSVPSFYQVNRDQAEVLYGKALDYAGLTGAGDGAGPVLRHRHHYPVPGAAGRTGHRRGDCAGGHPGRQGERRPEPH